MKLKNINYYGASTSNIYNFRYNIICRRSAIQTKYPGFNFARNLK